MPMPQRTYRHARSLSRILLVQVIRSVVLWYPTRQQVSHMQRLLAAGYACGVASRMVRKDGAQDSAYPT
jgi:hypothetical protein